MSEAQFKNCFLCRVMRSFAITGLGAGVLGFGALFFGVEHQDAVYWAVAGGMLALPWVGGRRPR